MSTITAQPLTGSAVWHGRDLARSTDWIRSISAAAVPELDAALATVKARGLAWADITRNDFPLPALGVELAAVAHELEHGRGIVLLRGLPVARYTEDELRQIYWGLGTHLGAARYQNAHGELIGEVRDELRAYGAVSQPGVAQKDGAPVTSRYKARSSGPLRFHTDRADVVGLLCVRPARSGGVSKIVSSVAINNAILARRPDLHALLHRDYYRTREGEERGGDRRWYALPVFGVRDGRFTSQYSRTFVEAAQRIPEIPRMTPAQDEALDLLAEVAKSCASRWSFRPATSSS
jgi:Taurine catabolism dioxygenase TauD, TfdA family